MPQITCLTCKRTAQSTLFETGWESYPGGWLVRGDETVCSMLCADEHDRRLAAVVKSATVPIDAPTRPSWCTAYIGGLCCVCHKNHSSNTCCAHDEPVVPR